jgi:putative ATPase
VRAAIAAAEESLGGGGPPTVLFVDEIHRFHAGQQDALLHAVEDGRLTLIGATTENPSFSVNGALLSRCRVLRLEALDPASQVALLRRALTDAERGLRALGLRLAPAAEAELLEHAGGDARVLLDTLERAALRSAAEHSAVIAEGHVAAARGERTALHDRSGDRHYDLLSALHKSLRGSDPDAAAYWVERLLVAGEDPRVVARRLVRMASEDVGLADPAALGLALDALHAVQFLGLPEGDAALVQAAVYLALAPKSDAVYRACLAAREAAQARPDLGVPLELRNAPTPLLREAGAGRGYVSPHTVAAGVTSQDHLPAELAGRRFYEPGERGAEAELRRRLEAVRAARAAAEAAAPRGRPAEPPDTTG